MVHSKPAMSLPNYSLTSHPPYRWKPELLGLTTSVLMSEGLFLPIPMCDALPLIGTSEPVKQTDVFRDMNEELSELGQTGHVFKEEFPAKDGDMLHGEHEDRGGQRGAEMGRHLTWHGQAQTCHRIQATGLPCAR